MDKCPLTYETIQDNRLWSPPIKAKMAMLVEVQLKSSSNGMDVECLQQPNKGFVSRVWPSPRRVAYQGQSLFYPKKVEFQSDLQKPPTMAQVLYTIYQTEVIFSYCRFY